MYIIRNVKDGRVVTVGKNEGRFYVRNSGNVSDELELFITDDIKEAYDVLEATKSAWAGINVDAWRIIDIGEVG